METYDGFTVGVIIMNIMLLVVSLLSIDRKVTPPNSRLYFAFFSLAVSVPLTYASFGEATQTFEMINIIFWSFVGWISVGISFIPYRKTKTKRKK